MQVAHEPSQADEAAVERLVGAVLRGGVLASAAVTAAGGALYLARHGSESVNYAVFNSEPANLRSLEGILRGAAAGRAEWIIAAGLLLLIATPIARVGVLLVTFVKERDRLYVSVSAVVLIILMLSVFDRSV